MPAKNSFQLKHSLPLSHHGMCYLLGVTSEAHIFVEEYYDETFIAQHQITLDGDTLKSRDEAHGKHQITPFDLPPDCLQPQRPVEHPLNRSGFRRRGLRETDKVAEWVQPISVMEKMQLLNALNLAIPAMMILGITESNVLCTTKINRDVSMVCREVHLLRAMPQIEHDIDGLPYDYTTIQLNLIHPYDDHSEDHPPLHEAVTNFPQIQRPMDCIYTDNHLIVTENSTPNCVSQLHIFMNS